MKRLKTKLLDIIKLGIKTHKKIVTQVSCYTDVTNQHVGDKCMKKLMITFCQVLSSISAINLRDTSSYNQNDALPTVTYIEI